MNKMIAMGDIVFWTLVRAAIIIPLIWFAQPLFDYGVWWMLGVMSIYVGIIHPAVIQYHLYLEQNKPIFEGTLCSSCRNFDTTAVLCLKHDEHPTVQYLPCDGIDWEPKPIDFPEEKVSPGN